MWHWCAVVLLCCATAHAQIPQHLTSAQYGEDFDQVWRFVTEKYCCFDQKATDWERVRERYRPEAERAADTHAFVAVLEGALDELYDAHTHLTVNLASSWRLPPFDMWAEWRSGKAIITDVRPGSPAAHAGIIPGDEIVSMNSKPIVKIAAERLPKTLRHSDPAAEAWALRSAISGRHDGKRVFEIRTRSGEVKTYSPDDAVHEADKPAVSSKRMEGNLGYIRISSFADEVAIGQFDRALEELKQTRALIVDVRDNHGGDTAVSRPIMGRFLRERKQYAWMARRDGKGLGKRWREFVEPRGPWTYTRPEVVLTNHFSESTAEGFAMGMQGIKRAVAVGTPMAQLGAGTAHATLSNSKIGVQVSAEPVYDVSGRSRDEFVPAVTVDLTRADFSGSRDPILDAAMEYLRNRMAR